MKYAYKCARSREPRLKRVITEKLISRFDALLGILLKEKKEQKEKKDHKST